MNNCFVNVCAYPSNEACFYFLVLYRPLLVRNIKTLLPVVTNVKHGISNLCTMCNLFDLISYIYIKFTFCTAFSKTVCCMPAVLEFELLYIESLIKRPQ